MTAVSEAAKAKAVELANLDGETECRWVYSDLTSSPALSALARFIQEVSDMATAVGNVSNLDDGSKRGKLLAPFILPDPVDPLYEALFAVVELGRYDTREQTQLLRAELAKRGLSIVEASK